MFGKRELRALFGSATIMIAIGVPGFLAIMLFAYFSAVLFGPGVNESVFWTLFIAPWALFGVRLIVEATIDMKETPPATVDPAEQPLFEKNVFVTTKTNRKSVATMFFLCAVPLLAAGAVMGDEIYFGVCFKLVLGMTAFLLLRWALPFVMRRSSTGVHTHASWVLAVLLWPAYATTVYKLGVPTALFDMGEGLSRKLIFGS